MKFTTHQLDILSQCALFKGVSYDELLHLLPCLKPIIQNYTEGQFIFNQGDLIQYIYIILDGKVELTKENLAGKKNIVALFSPGNLFGEGVVCTSHRLSPVSATALTNTTKLLLIPYKRIISSCSNSCSFHHLIVYNMMRLIADKNYHLNTKMDLLLLKGMRPYKRIISSCSNSCSFHHLIVYNMMRLIADKNYHLNTKMDLLLLKGMREKLATYLLSEAHLCQSLSFTLSLNRNQLADYLNVSRPSMCRELGLMKQEGLIDYYQNSFKILDTKKLQNILL